MGRSIGAGGGHGVPLAEASPTRLVAGCGRRTRFRLNVFWWAAPSRALPRGTGRGRKTGGSGDDHGLAHGAVAAVEEADDDFGVAEGGAFFFQDHLLGAAAHGGGLFGGVEEDGDGLG